MVIVAQISDVHAAPGNDNMARLDRALSWLTRFELDALVISGDLIDDGWTDGYDNLSKRFDNLRIPVLTLPGNSDDRSAMRAEFAARDGAVAGDGAMHFTLKIDGLRLIGIDTCLENTPAGDAAPHLAWLQHVLDEADAGASLLFTHHHLFASGIPPMDAVMSRGGQQLGEMLALHPLPPLAISSGHVHRPMTGILAGIPAHICGSICAANPLWFGGPMVPVVNEPPMIMIHRLTSEGLVSSHVAV